MRRFISICGVAAFTVAILLVTIPKSYTSTAQSRGYSIDRSAAGAVEPDALTSSMGPCSMAHVVGDWGVRFSGKLPDGTEVTGVNTFHLEKDGTATMHAWVNAGGGYFFENTGRGKITVDADCTGRLVEEGEGAAPPSKFVILRRGREVWGVYEAPYFMTYIGKRMDKAL